ncbi:hypothetical protein VFPFJ_01042 [Purpureocillium lilacinum]|uniref:Uncharacterized protein n=1 Tax=Purpureocillium lilacinum TaxID=33203 RepID=A0A179I078_PURLI|nr:hypothetical protein VFPFJ_01042 [Purpureocillium lilacinum]OAQ94933.1 hypothetical protein VFPFJ_01042 [Purpureocillium lilacinum]
MARMGVDAAGGVGSGCGRPAAAVPQKKVEGGPAGSAVRLERHFQFSSLFFLQQNIARHQRRHQVPVPGTGTRENVGATPDPPQHQPWRAPGNKQQPLGMAPHRAPASACHWRGVATTQRNAFPFAISSGRPPLSVGFFYACSFASRLLAGLRCCYCK